MRRKTNERPHQEELGSKENMRTPTHYFVGRQVEVLAASGTNLSCDVLRRECMASYVAIAVTHYATQPSATTPQPPAASASNFNIILHILWHFDTLAATQADGRVQGCHKTSTRRCSDSCQQNMRKRNDLSCLCDASQTTMQFENEENVVAAALCTHLFFSTLFTPLSSFARHPL
ncbi:unnamed protein product [Ceratitis capitata]|uniref:(Mediterranean fruit fly) hypothetical protein n=1 Tax=Ceratitis capitata TaxID=7213 RepID=A0A811V2Y1_CERCA|nr:unnamed protein product [Ceratitis capitata]